MIHHPRVVNVRHRGAEWDRYVGRGRCPCKARFCPHGPTGFGNPYTVEQDGETAMIKFIAHIETRMREAAGFAQAVRDLAGKRLGCWCAPGGCHASVLAHVADGVPIATLRAAWMAELGVSP